MPFIEFKLPVGSLQINHASLDILGNIIELNGLLVNSSIFEILYNQMMTYLLTHDSILDPDCDSAGIGFLITQTILNIDILSLGERSFKPNKKTFDPIRVLDRVFEQKTNLVFPVLALLVSKIQPIDLRRHVNVRFHRLGWRHVKLLILE